MKIFLEILIEKIVWLCICCAHCKLECPPPPDLPWQNIPFNGVSVVEAGRGHLYFKVDIILVKQNM